MKIEKPVKGEYAHYYENYINLAADSDIIETLEKQMNIFSDLLSSISEPKSLYKYEEGKWSIRELACHCVDTERIMAYRALCIARGDSQSLPGFDENSYVENSEASHRSLNSIIQEFRALRTANILLFKSLNEKQLINLGKANTHPVSARAIIYIIAGHLEHHMQILIRRYLN